MINLDKGVTVAKIAKVREKISDGEKDIDNIDDIAENVDEES
jgi:DNA gyrase subunit A